MNGTENRTAINNMRTAITLWEETFINKPHENQAKFRIGETTVYVITTFDEITIVYDDVLITCQSESIENILNMVREALENVGTN